jgi:hypothetical protein
MNYRSSIRFALASAVIVLCSSISLADENDVLLKILVRKGVLSAEEAASVKAEVAREKAKADKMTAATKAAPAAGSPTAIQASKFDISKSVEKIKLYGDIRLRYAYDDKDPQLFIPDGTKSNDIDRSPSGVQTSRWRFRLRVGADVFLTHQWSAGVELSTAKTSDSANQTFENGFDDYDIFISKAFLRWDPKPALTFVGGKMQNPFYSTELVWDTDITPTGLAEIIRFHELFESTPDAVGYDKDGKTVATSKPARRWELSLIAGQFIFDDNVENNFDNDESTDAYLFQTQLLASYTFDNGVKATVAPGWLVENAATVTGVLNSNAFTDNTSVSGATRNISLILVPGDVSFKIGSIPAKVFWDFSYNIEGRKRADDIYNLEFLRNDVGQDSDDDVLDPDDFDSDYSPQDSFAYMIGFQIGDNKKAGDWSFRADWRQTGIAAVDPNLNDSDFAVSGELNTRGAKLTLAYNFTDFLIGGVTYYQSTNLRNDLIGGEVTGGNAIGDANGGRTLQVDLLLKF